MDRLQKKCLVASTALHGLLAGALLFGSAFLAPPSNTMDLDVLTVIPETLVDLPVSSPGGNPKVTQLPPSAPPTVKPEPPAPAPKPVSPPVTKPPPDRNPEPVAKPVTRPPDPTPEPQVADTPAPPKKRLPQVSTELITRKPEPRTQPPRTGSSDSDADERRQAREEEKARQQTVAGVLSRIGDIASSSTEVDIPGPGGEAYANYAQVVKTVYTRAWLVPPEVNDDEATVTASVTIARDGTVLDARIIGQSGNSAVDASVRRTLERVRTIGREFPTGSKETKRTFKLKFNLKAKRLLG